ncbi:UDP-N-acetyl glucosamine 2-epimerase [Amylibacter marinus]|uniref:UDP-N-acetyl glucosamine 2-epimerase n=1 Tax=Amylibacter marinus TaxID=1475483 RepID=A0ABQ5VTN8_9RHOB|nr:UDP-N-acetylglucosamine 2-epimerase [Amylibacter marinus]GLQ34689.1 UDP-N-acetyl glucosamine 2-epimerase [Amylibacter marinus]
MRKRIVFVTGTRADFGKIEPLAIAARDAGHDVSFFITGMHMMERYGLTKIEVSRVSGVGLIEFTNQVEGDPQDLILSKTILGFSDFLKENPHDLVVVHGDRIEALACSLVCATNYVRFAHIEGGEVSGTIDEVFRHCNTKLATYHFVSSDQAKERVQVLGEPESSIYVLGSPELDTHGVPTGLDIQTVLDHYEIPFDEYGVVLFHPVTSEAATMGAQARDLFDNLDKSGKNFVVISPNNDPGSVDIFAVLEGLSPQRFKRIPSMRFAYFSELLRNAQALIGNSSAGVREAPFLGIASLDIGSRQTNRSQAKSITAAAANDHETIAGFFKQSWGRRFERDQSFGAGSTAKRFVEVINQPKFWEADMQKTFVDYDKNT